MSDQEEASQVASQVREGAGTVLVSEDYLAFLHDALSENQARIKEILGETQAGAVFSWCADRLVRTVKVGRYASSPAEGVVRKLASWGMEVTWKEEGDSIRVEVKCPYARRMHAGMASREPRCPLGEYVLGAVRLEDSKAQLVRNGLMEDGVRFTLKGARTGDRR
jgi:hypothetical protein